ncbi:unnamed protein product [Symbiodinium microadriaticum]|nr:unnamed protein product [Symbiodinium sp. KB8]CAE7271376.1 unnamed protein product [Symbiodinium microadriaticum]
MLSEELEIKDVIRVQLVRQARRQQGKMCSDFLSFVSERAPLAGKKQGNTCDCYEEAEDNTCDATTRTTAPAVKLLRRTRPKPLFLAFNLFMDTVKLVLLQMPYRQAKHKAIFSAASEPDKAKAFIEVLGQTKIFAKQAVMVRLDKARDMAVSTWEVGNAVSPEQHVADLEEETALCFDPALLPMLFELERSILGLRRAQAPGPDGVTAELLKPSPSADAGALFPLLFTKSIVSLREPVSVPIGP